ncbi:hypothetical protein [Xanthomonas nasturtii]|uniref:Uncharacterized protein n=1 Tax=Xanthomonas nasturtii TaxID=1843581 RepID=A0ABT0LLF2_9XANT|nr:hypothetical protein [Xanthomonas nasturtii]MCL1530582.1 hypothetical protein [Xanthomonas nasturtii]MCL1542508.1 hypothetical protein [Xanthomonas nasturtii]MCL1550174.1 hypothetical protein [Xanthomonas nasturtii]MCL1559582.1 hypothetical protein [Xanthomonas nasturtii]MCL1579728.1 hypothetical protein [Xanthomonas nasturtii]
MAAFNWTTARTDRAWRRAMRRHFIHRVAACRSSRHPLAKISPHICNALQRKACSYLPTGFAEFDPHPMWTTLPALVIFSPPPEQTLRQ